MHRIQFERELRGDADHEHDPQYGWADHILIRSRMTMTNHAGSTRVLVHTVHNKGNGHGEQYNAVQLTDGIAIVLRKRENGNTGTGEHHAQVHPGEEGALVGEKYLGFNFDRRFARFEQRPDFPVRTRRLFGAPEFGQETISTSTTGAAATSRSTGSVAIRIVNACASFSLLISHR